MGVFFLAVRDNIKSGFNANQQRKETWPDRMAIFKNKVILILLQC